MIKTHLSPEWTYTHFLDSDIIDFFNKYPLEEFPNAISFFNSLNRGEHKADFFRYYYLYIKGGVFMDSDAMIYESIDKIISNYSFFSVNSKIVPGTIFQGIIGAEPSNLLIYKCLKSMYLMDINILNLDYHILCKNMYVFFNELPDKTQYHLYNEIQDYSGDRTIGQTGDLLFRHFWRNKENIPKRNLVYCCVFYNKDYLKLLDLLLKSMITYSSLEPFDLLVITQKDFEPLIDDISKKLGIYIRTFTLEISTFFQAACARLSIFDYPNIIGYDKILYIDTDILITANLKPILDLNIQDKLYALESGYISSNNFGAQFFDFNIIDPNKTGINSGTLLFLNSQTIKDLFSRIQSHVDDFTKEGTKIPYCMDQPFINYHAIKDSLYDNQTLAPYVVLFEGHHPDVAYEEKTICHFSFPIGNFGDKFRRMSEHFSNKLKTHGDVNYIDIIDKKFTWGEGYIKFIYDTDTLLKLETTWGKGFFQILNKYMVYVEWSSHCHVLKFNESYSEYASIRISPNDFDFIRGKQIESQLNIYGDSHALLLFHNLNIVHRNLYSFGKTMYSLGRDKCITNFCETQINKNTTYCFVYGEVDVRAHVGKQVFYGKHHEHICNDLVNGYFRSIKANIREYKNIIIVGIVPPTNSEDHTICKIHTDVTGGPLPFVGTDLDRKIYTDYMNSLIEKTCLEYGYKYFNPFSLYTREDGMMNRELSDGCVHVGNNDHFLNEFLTCLNY